LVPGKIYSNLVVIALLAKKHDVSDTLTGAEFLQKRVPTVKRSPVGNGSAPSPKDLVSKTKVDAQAAVPQQIQAVCKHLKKPAVWALEKEEDFFQNEPFIFLFG
jgi:hypothetical protein